MLVFVFEISFAILFKMKTIDDNRTRWFFFQTVRTNFLVSNHEQKFLGVRAPYIVADAAFQFCKLPRLSSFSVHEPHLRFLIGFMTSGEERNEFTVRTPLRR